MSIRPLNKERTKWQIDVYPPGGKGKRIRITRDGTEDSARELELEMLGGLDLASLTSPTIEELLVGYMPAARNNLSPQTYADILKSLRILFPYFGKTQVRALTRPLFEAYKTQRLDQGVKKRTVNKELSYLGSIIRWGVDERVCQPLPFKIPKFPAKQTEAPKPAVPPAEDLWRVYDHLTPRVRGLFLLMWHAGLRWTEARTLKAEHVSLHHLNIRVTGKGSKERVVSISTEELLTELKRAVERTGGKGYLYLSPITNQPYVDIRTAIEYAIKRAGVARNIYNHLLRHAYGTHSVIGGVNIRALQRLMGHSTVTVTELYTTLADEHLQTEAAKFGKLISRVSDIPVNDTGQQTKKRRLSTK